MSDQPDKALTFVPQILEAHQAFITSQKGTLEHAFKAGDLLNRAKETVIADNGGKRGKWEEWRDQYCGAIPQTTANMYMRLAENLDVIRKQQRVVANSPDKVGAEGKLSIRAALKLIPKNPKRVKAPKSAVEPPATRKSSTLEDVLLDKAADEVFAAIRDNWDDDKLGALTTLLKEYLNSKGVPPPVPMPNVGEITRRV
jgi:hypothetical protein